MGLRERKKEQTRRRIERAALDLFLSDGFDATTIEAIAEAAEISPRTFFTYFPAKEEVVFSLAQREELDRLETRIRDREPGSGAIEAIMAWILEVIGEEEDADERELSRRRLIRETPALAAYEAAHVDPRFEAIFARAIAADLALDPADLAPRMVAAAASAALRAIAEYYADSGEGLQPEAVLDEVRTFLDAGISALDRA